ncbi:ankyrin repeat domain-containing protein [Endozoicomonas sp. ONNA2]|uniref:ankyrin repeat domain-containing protein n=1 Tax=Endozoicomonas sp. ONNA2 TaxID=2828741 RepID=UPI0021493A16|nr:ankyrin repeat domain-containing protein [Endozoicomonas sp. ONNA2]
MHSSGCSSDNQMAFTSTMPSGLDATDKSSAPVPVLPKDTSLAHNSPVPDTALTARTITPSGHHNPQPLPENWQWQLVSGILNGEIHAISVLLQQGADVNCNLSSQIATLDQQPVNISGVDPSIAAQLVRAVEQELPYTPLWLAAITGNPELVKLLLSSGAHLECTNPLIAPLTGAAAAGHREIVQILLEHHADIQAGSTTGVNSPLYWAIKGGHQDLVAFLEKNGARLQIGCPGRDAPIHHAARMGFSRVVEYLLNRGEDIDNQSTGQLTPVYAAASCGHFELVRLLLERGANNSHGETGENTLIWAACFSGKLQTVKYLLDQGADINAGCEDFDAINSNTNPWKKPYPIEAAAYSGSWQLVEYLLERYKLRIDAPGVGTPLFRHAAEGGKVVMMDYIASRATINIDARGYYSPISSAARSGSIEAVAWLLDKGADIHANCRGQQTPICQACAQGHFELAKFLDSKGARLHDAGWGSPLYWAASAGSLDTVAYLLDRGVNVDAAHSGFFTPIYTATRRGFGKIVEYLLEKGADVNANSRGRTTPVVEAAAQGHLGLVKCLVHQSATCEAGRLLNAAANGGHCPVLEYLFEEKAILQHIEPSYFSMALIQASLQGRLNAIKYLLGAFQTHFSAAPGPDISQPLWLAAQRGDIDVVKYLVELGADVNVECQSLGSALWTASQSGRLSTVMYLCQQGANIHYSNPANNADVLSIAEQEGHQDVVRFLQQQLNPLSGVLSPDGAKNGSNVKWSSDVIEQETELHFPCHSNTVVAENNLSPTARHNTKLLDSLTSKMSELKANQD